MMFGFVDGVQACVQKIRTRAKGWNVSSFLYRYYEVIHIFYSSSHQDPRFHSRCSKTPYQIQRQAQSSPSTYAPD
jgi:hypothetical protein